MERRGQGRRAKKKNGKRRKGNAWGEEERKEKEMKEKKDGKGRGGPSGQVRKGRKRTHTGLIIHRQQIPPLCMPSCSLLVVHFTGRTIEGT